MEIGATGTTDQKLNEARATRARKPRGVALSYSITSWLGFAPFFIFCLLFELLPALMIVQSSLVDSNTGTFTLNNFQRVFAEPDKLHAFQNSISISIVTALIGAVIGFIAAYGVYNMRSNRIRNLIIGFSSVSANFAGIPLASAFIATLGATGFVTLIFLNVFHVGATLAPEVCQVLPLDSEETQLVKQAEAEAV